MYALLTWLSLRKYGPPLESVGLCGIKEFVTNLGGAPTAPSLDNAAIGSVWDELRAGHDGDEADLLALVGAPDRARAMVHLAVIGKECGTQYTQSASRRLEHAMLEAAAVTPSGRKKSRSKGRTRSRSPSTDSRSSSSSGSRTARRKQSRDARDRKLERRATRDCMVIYESLNGGEAMDVADVPGSKARKACSEALEMEPHGLPSLDRTDWSMSQADAVPDDTATGKLARFDDVLCTIALAHCVPLGHQLYAHITPSDVDAVAGLVDRRGHAIPHVGIKLGRIQRLSKRLRLASIKHNMSAGQARLMCRAVYQAWHELLHTTRCSSTHCLDIILGQRASLFEAPREAGLPAPVFSDRSSSDGRTPSTKSCRDWAVGKCERGDRCIFNHSSRPGKRQASASPGRGRSASPGTGRFTSKDAGATPGGNKKKGKAVGFN